jgi:hypothetical protein
MGKAVSGIPKSAMAARFPAPPIDGAHTHSIFVGVSQPCRQAVRAAGNIKHHLCHPPLSISTAILVFDCEQITLLASFINECPYGRNRT